MTQTKSPLVILRRIYLDITDNHCAAKLIEYFRHWREWKVKNHRTDWVYMPLRQIQEDLMGEHSLHVIRAAIALLEKLGFIKRRNNPGNGQDKTYQYQLNVDAIASKLAPETPEGETESPMLRTELSENNVEQHTQITTTDIQNTNIIPTKRVKVKKNEHEEEVESLVEKYKEKLKRYGVYTETRDSSGELIPHPKFEPIRVLLSKVNLERAERAISRYLISIKDQKEDKIQCKYKLLYSAIARN